MSDPQRVPHDSYVAIDVETTGLDPQADRIIEVAATRFDRSGAAGHFSSLVDPGRPIPAQVQALTGIGDADVVGAPTITRVGAELAVFAGGRAVVGHNVRFDLDFLIASGIELAGAALDTWELASVLLPTAARLNLGSLAELLSVDMPVAHRALADAEATRDVFLRLLTALDALPRAALIDLRAIAESADWGLAPLFAAAAERAATATPPAAGDGELAALTLPPPPAPPPPPERRDPPEPVTADDVERLFAAAVARPGPAAGIRAAQRAARDGTGGGGERRARGSPGRRRRHRHRQVAGLSPPDAAARAAQRGPCGDIHAHAQPPGTTGATRHRVCRGAGRGARGRRARIAARGHAEGSPQLPVPGALGRGAS